MQSNVKFHETYSTMLSLTSRVIVANNHLTNEQLLIVTDSISENQVRSQNLEMKPERKKNHSLLTRTSEQLSNAQLRAVN